MPATLVLSRAVKPGRIDALRHRMDEMTAAAASAEGFAGSVRMAQTDALQYLLCRFHSRALLDRFRESGAYAALITRGEALATGLDQVEEGRRVRIELPRDAAAWKRFLVTWLSVLPILLVVGTAARECFHSCPRRYGASPRRSY